MTEDQICIDGKALRGSFCPSKSVKALHRVDAWSTATSLSLGQVSTAEKSNKINAIPEFLKLIDLKNYLVSIGAAVKENQWDLFSARSITKSELRLTQDDYSMRRKKYSW